MLTIGGRKKNTRGGASPYDNKGIEGYPRGGSTNFANVPNIPPKSMQVGGMGYGYATGADAATFGGSYFPTAKVCSAAVDPSRGGNNFMSGGGKRSSGRKSKGKRSSGRKSKRSGSRRTKGGKRSGSRRSGGTKKWKQRGCMNGGFGVIPI